MTDQTYCDRLVQDTPFLTGQGRLSEQQVDRIILQLNRYYPQILTNKEAEKFRNPRASLRVRLCDLLSHLQRSGERDCQEFYRALYIHAQPLHSRLPSRCALRPHLYWPWQTLRLCSPFSPADLHTCGCRCRASPGLDECARHVHFSLEPLHPPAVSPQAPGDVWIPRVQGPLSCWDRGGYSEAGMAAPI
ncbi:caspase recruitment domain-containing protein 19 isoform X2 [Eulemur rufifrons]|uniref:caspase recruitment domain-containing protein 19 isoform X2 n=1 Tax=Eulemur rufifrons TaxID=859984 RepID=UPI0037431D87